MCAINSKTPAPPTLISSTTKKKRTQFEEEFSPLNLIYYRLLVYFELTEVEIFTNEHLLEKKIYVSRETLHAKPLFQKKDNPQEKPLKTSHTSHFVLLGCMEVIWRASFAICAHSSRTNGIFAQY